MQTLADSLKKQRQIIRKIGIEGETWSPSEMSQLRSRPVSLMADWHGKGINSIHIYEIYNDIYTVWQIAIDINTGVHSCWSGCITFTGIHFVYFNHISCISSDVTVSRFKNAKPYGKQKSKHYNSGSTITAMYRNGQQWVRVIKLRVSVVVELKVT